MPYPFVGDVDMTQVHFGPMQNDGTRQKVEMHRDATSNKSSNKLVFNLCKDARKPFACRYRLDTVREDQDGSRRGLIVRIQDESVQHALQALDDQVVQHALKNCKEFFKKSNMTEAEVRLRYKALVTKVKEEDEDFCIKFKVKCKGWPTVLHLLRDDRTIEEDGATLEDISQNGAYVAPILSAYGLWFMGGGTSFGVTIQAERMVVKKGAPRPALDEFTFTDTPLQTVKRQRVEEDASVDAEEFAAEGRTSTCGLEDDFPKETIGARKTVLLGEEGPPYS